MLEKLSLQQLSILYHITNFAHVILTALVIIIFFVTFKIKQVWQFYLVLGVFFLQQAILSGCFLSSFQNSIAAPLGYPIITNQFMFGFNEGMYLNYYRLLAGILGIFYLYMSGWCAYNKYKK